MNTTMALRVAFGTDHGGLPLRELVLDELRAAGASGESRVCERCAHGRACLGAASPLNGVA